MTFATDLEQLLEDNTSRSQSPSNAAPQDATREWYTCDLCLESDEDAWAIPHSDDCLAGKVQRILLDE